MHNTANLCANLVLNLVIALFGVHNKAAEKCTRCHSTCKAIVICILRFCFVSDKLVATIFPKKCQDIPNLSASGNLP